MSSTQKNPKQTTKCLFNAPYPFQHEHFKTIYEKCKQIPLTGVHLYHCNFCKIKLLGEQHLSEHNSSSSHQAEIGKITMEMLKNPKLSEQKCVKLPDSVKEMMEKTALKISEMKLKEAMVELKIQYEQYDKYPNMHPMYNKEWKIFYLRRCSDLLAENRDPNTYNFTNDWTAYWKQRMGVYYNEALHPIIEAIGANYVATVSDDTSSNKEKDDKNVADDFDIRQMNPEDITDAQTLPNNNRTSKIAEQTTKTTIMVTEIDSDMTTDSGSNHPDIDMDKTKSNNSEQNVTKSDMDISNDSSESDSESDCEIYVQSTLCPPKDGETHEPAIQASIREMEEMRMNKTTFAAIQKPTEHPKLHMVNVAVMESVLE